MTIPNKDRFNDLTPDEVEESYLFEDGEHVIKHEPFTFKEKLHIFTVATVMTACVAVLFALFSGNWKTANDFCGLFIAYWSFLLMHKFCPKSKSDNILIVALSASLTLISAIIMELAILHQLQQIELIFK